MLDQPARAAGKSAINIDPRLAGALERASRGMSRLDQALTGHPLLPAFLYRLRLEAVRRQAAVDGQIIDPWHLAAVLEGLRLRMDHALRVIDRGAIFEAARHALTLHQWLTAADFDQEGEIQRAEVALVKPETGASVLLSAAIGVHAWLDDGGERQAIRAALIRYWARHGLLHVVVPLTGAAALRAETPWATDAWAPVFLNALAEEADDARQLLLHMERAWVVARNAVAGRRSNSRAAAAIDLLAAAPLLSARSLASGLEMAPTNALGLLADFCAKGIAVEVTWRSRRRLFGLAGLAPLRAEVAPPHRPEPGRGRGRPPRISSEMEPEPEIALTPPPLITPLQRRSFEYGDLEQAMAGLESAIRGTRRTLDALARAQIEQGANSAGD